MGQTKNGCGCLINYTLFPLSEFLVVLLSTCFVWRKWPEVRIYTVMSNSNGLDDFLGARNFGDWTASSRSYRWTQGGNTKCEDLCMACGGPTRKHHCGGIMEL